jgi:hypothetical protein
VPKKPWSYTIDGFKEYFRAEDKAMREYHVDFLMGRDTEPFPSLQEVGIDPQYPKFIKERGKNLKGFGYAAKLMRDTEIYDYVSQARRELESGNSLKPEKTKKQ